MKYRIKKKYMKSYLNPLVEKRSSATVFWPLYVAVWTQSICDNNRLVYFRCDLKSNWSIKGIICCGSLKYAAYKVIFDLTKTKKFLYVAAL